MTSSKRKKLPAQPLRAVPSEPPATIAAVTAVPTSGYTLVASAPRIASVVIERTDGEEYYGIVVDEEFELLPLTDEDLEEDSDELDEAEDEAAGDLAERFATAKGVPLVLPPTEALRVFTAVQRAVCALRSQLVQVTLDQEPRDTKLTDYRVTLIRPAVLAEAPADSE